MSSKSQEQAREFIKVMKEYLAGKLAPIQLRMAELELVVPNKGVKGDQGEAGTKGDPGDRGDKGDKGEQGEKGEAGEAVRGEKGDPGERGEKGDRGEPGDAGKDGEQGPVGERGEKGEQGIAGATGLPGPIGEKGDPGEQGEPGDIGTKGDTGERGEKGDPGDKGEKGDVGVGIKGEPGDKGDKGDPGDRGERGEKGDIGERGEKGADAVIDFEAIGEVIEVGIKEAVAKLPPAERGEKGDTGERGERGESGLPGEKGDAGERGEKGDAGMRGEKGDDASLDAERVRGVFESLSSGFAKAEELSVLRTVIEAVQKATAEIAGIAEARIEALTKQVEELTARPTAPASFVINDAGALVAAYPDGVMKDVGVVRGARGASIMDGAVNGDGQLVLRMSDGRHVNVGTVRGRDGDVGKSGAHGRDALEIQPMPGIDESRSYAEGVCARYRGGMIRADRQTDPVVAGDIIKAGWSVILEGIADEGEEVLDEGRVVVRTTTYTSGRVFAREHTSSKLVFRGIWAPGDYRKGDLVSRGGSMWHCEAGATAENAPGAASTHWKLIVKAGSPGRDGRPGERGAAGSNGTTPPTAPPSTLRG